MIKASYAQEISTPPTGVDLAGYFNLRLNEGYYDDLYVKVVALEIDGKRTAIVSLDLQHFSTDDLASFLPTPVSHDY